MLPKRNAVTTTTTPMTNAQIKALIAQGVVDALAERDADRSKNGNDNHDLGSGGRRRMPVARECTYSDFLKCQPLNFKGTIGVVGLTQWFEMMESNFHIRNCAVRNQVKYVTCTLLGNALTWWNSHVKTELALLCGRMFPEESDKVEKYVGGLPGMIQGSVMAFKPKKMQDTIEFATELMDQKIRTLAESQAENKESLMTTTKLNNNPPPPRSKMWQGLILLGLVRRRSMLGLYRCATSASFTTMARALQSVQTTRGSDCPELKNRNHGNQAGGINAYGMVYALEGGETDQDLDNMEDDINA
ncbi:hypothetical protein Tco_1186221 [Tanacetum coccineum]